MSTEPEPVATTVSSRPVAEDEQKAKTTPASQEREPSQQETAMQIADRLGERDHAVRGQIVFIVKALGRTQAQSLLEQTMQIEEQGGMMLASGSRRRTPGGVFFHLVYTTGRTKMDGELLQRPAYQKPASAKPAQKPMSPLPSPSISATAASLFTWNERMSVIEAIGEAKGKANVKITVIGKPGTFVDKGACVVAVIQSDKVPLLPKGVPEPAAAKTNYVVYVAAKQWKTIAGTLDDAEDMLIIEGFPQIDAETKAISVFANSITSKKLQAAKRQSQPQKTT
ncbi:MAG: phosphorylated adapter RNA export RNA-binding domain-containing protein [Ktedonobacteraceae bacterium]